MGSTGHDETAAYKRKIRRLMADYDPDAETWTLDLFQEVVSVCEYRARFGRADLVHSEAEARECFIVLGFEETDFTEQRRSQILIELRATGIVEIASNDLGLLQHVGKQIEFAVSDTAGSA